MHQLQWEATICHISDRVHYQTRKSKKQKSTMLVKLAQDRKPMDAAHNLSRHWRREGTLAKLVEQYWWPKM